MVTIAAIIRVWDSDILGRGLRCSNPPPKFRSFDEAELKYTVLTYQKLRKFYCMKWNFLYQIIAASRTPDYPHSLSPLSSTEFVELLPPPGKRPWVAPPPRPEKIPGYATGIRWTWFCLLGFNKLSMFHILVFKEYFDVCSTPTNAR
jgi:hypothetical protein